MTSQTVLIVDKDTGAGERLASILRNEGYDAIQAASYAEALRMAEKTEPGLALLDTSIKDASVSGFITDLKELSPDWVCAMAADAPDIDSTPSTFQALTKPINPEEVISTIKNAFRIMRQKEEIRRLETLFTNSESYLLALLENTGDAVFIKDTEHRYILANPNALQWFKLASTNLIGKRDGDADTPFSEGGIKEKETYVLLGHPLEEDIVTMENESPVVHHVLRIPIHDRDGTAVGIMGIAKNISEKRILEDRLVLAQKMEAIGVLAGGIAHDFNNILGAIVGHVELARLDTAAESREHAHLTEVLKAAKRATDLVKQILTFSRQDTQPVKSIRIAPIIDECLHLIRASLPASIEICPHIKDDSGVVRVDATQMHQVLMNLASNAGHAMAAHGGKLYVGLENICLGSEEAPALWGLMPGPYVRISVQDTGHGMDEATLQKIFELYFTTKEEGIGTGLGLAVVRSIAAAAGGAVTVESELGRGSTFFVFLPRFEVADEEWTERARPVPSGHERILYVDDESMLADIGKKMLEKLGYEVVADTHPLSALDIYRSNPMNFDLIITDQTMPDMTGVELARQVMRIRPDIPIIICSGFTESPEYEEAGRLGIDHFLRKPFIMKEFGEIVRKVLDDRSH